MRLRHDVDDDGDHADDERRAAVAQRVEARRRDLDRRVADQPGRVEHAAPQRWRPCRRGRTARARAAAIRSGRASTIEPDASPARSASSISRSAPAIVAPQRRDGPRRPPCREISGSAAVAIETPNRPDRQIHQSERVVQPRHGARAAAWWRGYVLTNTLICTAARPSVPGAISCSICRGALDRANRRSRLVATPFAPQRRPLDRHLPEPAEHCADRDRRRSVADRAWHHRHEQKRGDDRRDVEHRRRQRRNEEPAQRVQHAHHRDARPRRSRGTAA